MLGFFSFLELIAIIILFVMMSNLKNRVRVLEKSSQKNTPEVKPLSVAPKTSEIVAPFPSTIDGKSLQKDQGKRPNKEGEDLSPSNFFAIFHWLKEDWLMKVGALLLLIGFGWLVTYAFLNNWIGPMGRITLGIIAGAGILILGSWRIKKHLHQGTIFTALGSTVILLTVFAAREMYDFFTPLTGLGIMFLSTVFVAFVSVRYRAKSLAIVGLILAAVAPNLVASARPDYISLFSYLAVIILGVIWIVIITGWRELTLMALIISFLYSIPVLGGSVATKSTILLFAYGFSSLFFIFNTIGLIKVKNKSTRADIFTAAGNGLFLLAWILLAAQKEWQSLLIVAWMLVFSSGAFLIFKYTRQKFAFYIYAGVSIAMLAAATAAELDGSALVIAYILESAVISFITAIGLRDYVTGQKFSLLMIGPILLGFETMERFTRTRTVFNEHFFALLTLALSLFVLGLVYKYYFHTMPKAGFFAKFHVWQIIVGSLYVYVLLWYSFRHGLDNRSVAIMLSMVIYTLIGLGTHIYGKVKNKKIMYLYGGVMLAFVVLRLLVVDVWQMDLTRRIVTFFLIGALLISTAFINKRKFLNNNLSK